MSEERRRIAVYPGSFDPLHNGHLDIIERCVPIFDEVIVAVLRNTQKSPLFSVDERVEVISKVLAGYGNCQVKSFTGLLVHFMDQVTVVDQTSVQPSNLKNQSQLIIAFLLSIGIQMLFAGTLMVDS